MQKGPALVFIIPFKSIEVKHTCCYFPYNLPSYKLYATMAKIIIHYDLHGLH